MIYLLVGCFILLDFITGLIKAFKNKEFCSSLMREGLYHKAGSIIVIVFGALVDKAQVYMDLGITIPIASTICIYITLMEIGSIIENLYQINPCIIPDKLQGYFHKINEHKTNLEERKDDKDQDSQSKKG